MRSPVMRRVLALVGDVREAPDVDAFLDRALAGLAELVPSDEITFNDLDLEGRAVHVLRSIPDAQPVADGYFWEHWRELPICWTADPGTRGVRRDSDVIDRAALRRLEVYDVLMRPLLYTMKASFAAPSLTSRAFLLSRTDRDFSDTERDLLRLLLPHLEAAYRRVRLAARLSEREREILALVAKGMTNREIAEALYLSPLTVRTHLEHIFVKLGVRTRTAAAAFAPEPSGRSLGAGV